MAPLAHQVAPLAHQVVPLALVTRWCHLPFASRNFCHHMMPHPLFETCTDCKFGTTCISCKLGHQVAQLALIQNLVISWYQHDGGVKQNQWAPANIIKICWAMSEISTFCINSEDTGRHYWERWIYLRNILLQMSIPTRPSETNVGYSCRSIFCSSKSEFRDIIGFEREPNLFPHVYHPPWPERCEFKEV